MSRKKVTSLILSSYFSEKIHPNSPQDSAVVGRMANGKVANNSYDYIKVWYESVKDKEIDCVVFHDKLSDDFVETYSTDRISFEKVEVNEYSNNDFRFFCFSEYLNNLKDKPDVVFHNDISDVKVVKDPSELINTYPKVDYFCCRDSIMLSQFPYIEVHRKFNWDDTFLFILNENSWELINMGVIGGSFNKMKEFYNSFVEVRTSMAMPSFNADMWVLQYLLRSYIKTEQKIVGYPICSEFKGYQNNREDVYFIHK
jgi:hypothetical protein